MTCGFAGSRHALSRCPRAVGAGTSGSLGTSAISRKGTRPNLPPQRMFSSCRWSPPLPLTRCAGMLRHASAGIASLQAVHVGARLTLTLLCWRSVSVCREPSGRAWPPSSPSSPPVRCPGSGFVHSRRLLASKPLRPPWRSRGTTASPHPASGGDPPPLPRQPAGVPSAETRLSPPVRPSPPIQRHPSGSSRVGEEGRVIGELSERAGQDHPSSQL